MVMSNAGGAEQTETGHGPDRQVRAICATTNRGRLPRDLGLVLEHEFLRGTGHLEELMRLYGLRNWVEQSYKQIKDKLGWADFIGQERARPSTPLDAGLLCIFILRLAGGEPFTYQRPFNTARLALAGTGKIGEALHPIQTCWPRVLRAVQAS
jgi:hypothetical protein